MISKRLRGKGKPSNWAPPLSPLSLCISRSATLFLRNQYSARSTTPLKDPASQDARSLPALVLPTSWFLLLTSPQTSRGGLSVSLSPRDRSPRPGSKRELWSVRIGFKRHDIRLQHRSSGTPSGLLTRKPRWLRRPTRASQPARSKGAFASESSRSTEPSQKLFDRSN